jgi:hypothetical protein
VRGGLSRPFGKTKEKYPARGNTLVDVVACWAEVVEVAACSVVLVHPATKITPTPPSNTAQKNNRFTATLMTSPPSETS